MTVKVILPKTGMGIEEATIAKWLKAVGDDVRRGEPLVEIETAKATQEVVSPVSGRLVEILLSEGQVGSVNMEIAAIEEKR